MMLTRGYYFPHDNTLKYVDKEKRAGIFFKHTNQEGKYYCSN